MILPVFNFHLVADTKHYPVFVGHRPGRNNTQRHKLDIQLIVITNRTLYIAARSVCLLSTCIGAKDLCWNANHKTLRVPHSHATIAASAIHRNTHHLRHFEGVAFPYKWHIRTQHNHNGSSRLT